MLKIRFSFTRSVKGLAEVFLLGGALSTLSVFVPGIALANYFLPFPQGRSYSVTQTWENPNGSHKPSDPINRFGVDFGMPIGHPVSAVASGRVIKAWNGGTNKPRGCNRAFINNANYVVIDHNNGLSSVYVHLNSVDVTVGQNVQQGQIIGKSGDTGFTCNSDPKNSGPGPHLHFAFQRTNTNAVFSTSVAQGFVETSNGSPVRGRSYTSQNRSGVPTASMMVSQGSGRALDAGGGNGTIYPHPNPDGNNTFHRWRFDRIAGTNEYMIVSVATGRALDAGGANGSQAYTHPNPSPHNAFHRWRLQPSGAGFMVISVATGRALDAGGANGTQIYMHPRPDGNPFHVWRLN